MSYNGRKNYFTGNVMSDEWYTPQNIVDKCFEIAKELGLNESHTVLFPFDTDESLFVKTANGTYNSIFGIVDFMDDMVYYDYDYLLTNPPFSIKSKVFEKCLKNGKPFILIIPEASLFSIWFYKLLEKYKFNYKVYSPNRRICFIDEEGNQTRPNFHSVIISVSKNYNENTIEHFNID